MSTTNIKISFRKILLLGVIAGLMLLQTGCRAISGASGNGQSQDAQTQDDQMAQEAQAAQGSYQIYYKNAASDALSAVSYVPTGETFNDILTELFTQFALSPGSDTLSALPDSVTIQTFTRGVDSLTIDFDAGYLALSAVDEVLLRAAIVRTLVQLPGVVGIRITVDGQELTNAAGEAFGIMNEDTFVDSEDDGINSLRQVTLTLYFPSEDESTLQAEEQTVRYSTNLTMERVIAEQLLKGPQSDTLQAVAVSGTRLNSIRVENGICLIDLDESFSTDVSGVSPESALQAFVTSICEACEVDGVQFMIDGTSDVRFRDQVSLNQVFYPETE